MGIHSFLFYTVVCFWGRVGVLEIKEKVDVSENIFKFIF